MPVNLAKDSSTKKNLNTNANDLKKTIDSFFSKSMSDLKLSDSLKRKFEKRLDSISKKAAEDFSYILDEMEEQ